MATVSIDPSHDCESGGSVVPGLIPVHQAARSACCGAILAEGGIDEAGHTCTGCSQPTTRVMGPPTARWTCDCGTVRSQIVTQPQDA